MIRYLRKIIRFFGWLLTPLVAWAVSFLGAWLGALAAPRFATARGAVLSVAAGAVLGAMVGAALWVIAIKWSARRGPGVRRPVKTAPPAEHPAAEPGDQVTSTTD